jgi:ribosomal-protein-alanine N-acetyltransferase
MTTQNVNKIIPMILLVPVFDISLKETGGFIGEAGLIYLAFDQKNEDVEASYTLHKKYWGKGHATELARVFIKWGFDNFHFSRIVACCETENTASSNVMKKCGMKYKGKYLYNGKNECDIYHINNITIKTDDFYVVDRKKDAAILARLSNDVWLASPAFK